MEIIKVGFCVAYDWEFLKVSLPRVYPYSDKICLSIDSKRRSWRGEPYEFDESSFRNFITDLDQENKIDILEDDFSNSKNNSRENCNLQRTTMAEALGKNGWHIQVDADEYFLNFKGFKNFLLKIDPNPKESKKPVNVLVNWLPIYKRTGNTFFLVDFEKKLPESAPFATTKPEYLRARNNGHFNILSPEFALHETWARSRADLKFKISNWGHASEELSSEKARDEKLIQWDSVNETNYMHFENLNAAKPEAWPQLKMVKANSIEELIKLVSTTKLPISTADLWLRNRRSIGKLRQWFKF
jgi:hypothetical protein